jgi:Ni,Fe-hydrogenase III component G
MIALEQAQEILVNCVQTWHVPEDHRLDAQVSPTNLLPAVKALDYHAWGYLVAITGLDGGPDVGEFLVLYHFCSGPAVLTLRVTIPRRQAALPSICSIIPYASVFERELAEMFGIEVYGTPDPSRLFLPDNWPDGIYPLRKDAELD